MTVLKNGKFLHPVFAALGFFDGVHKGHMSLIKKAAQLAENGGKSLIYTFDLHPKEVMGKNIKLITEYEEKANILDRSGVDFVYVQHVTKDFLNLSAEQFVRGILKETLNVKTVVAGENYTFGRRKEGSSANLKHLCGKYGINCVIMPYIKENGHIVSSSAIRRFIECGDIPRANNFLGRCYSISGTVIRGRMDGRRMGFPTVNIEPQENKILPPFGVYATRVWMGEKYTNSITNLGTAPTFGENRRLAETNILGFNGNLYGKNLKIEFLAPIRGEKKFSGPDELKLQIASDIEQRKNMKF